jgi:parallel beta-helix repeat protein
VRFTATKLKSRTLCAEPLETRHLLSAGALGIPGASLHPSPPAGAVILTPSESAAAIQQAVSSRPTGSKFFFDAGTYHDVSIVPKQGDQFIGQYGAILTTTTVLTAFDSYGTGGGNNVTIENLVITGYQADDPTGFPVGQPIQWTNPPYAAISAGDGWIINHVDVEFSKSAGVQISDGGILENSILSNNGQEGGKASQYPMYEADNVPIVVRNNLIENNNLAGRFSPTFEAGGFKVYDTNHVTFTQNTVTGNNGNGVWFDTNCSGTMISNNLVQNNTWNGINLEISGSTIVSGNVITGNATTPNPVWPSAGIQMQDQSNTTVSGNTIANNANSIIMFSSQRTDLGINWTLTNVVFQGNTITATTGIVAGIADAQNTGSNPYTPGNVVFKGNTYHVSGNAGFIYKSWLYVDEALSQWEALGND